MRQSWSILFLIGVAVISGCDRENKGILENEVEELEAQVSALTDIKRAKYDELSKKKLLVRTFEPLQEKETLERIEREEVTSYLADLKAADTYLTEKVAVWRKATRDSLIGLELGAVEITGGRILKDVVVDRVADGEIHFTHQEGEDTVSFEDLPMTVKRRLVHEPTILIQNHLTE